MLLVLGFARRSAIAVALITAAPIALFAQSQTELGENAWKTAREFALQGKADSAIAAFAQARSIALTLHDSSLLAAAYRGVAEVQAVYRGCRDSSLALLRKGVEVSIPGDRGAGQLLVRQLAAAGKTTEALAIHTALYADIKDEVPRSISRESVGYLSALAAIQRGAGQQSAALETLKSAREIADRLSSGDDTTVKRAPTDISSLNYWVAYDMAQLMLTSKVKGVSAPAAGKILMDAVARDTDEPEEGNERRFKIFRLADRLVVKAWRCELNGEKCPVPPPGKC
ncbi:MAG: hypothetical protein ABJC26_17090 [Gemmatimonadaceae bacterium]